MLTDYLFVSKAFLPKRCSEPMFRILNVAPCTRVGIQWFYTGMLVCRPVYTRPDPNKIVFGFSFGGATCYGRHLVSPPGKRIAQGIGDPILTWADPTLDARTSKQGKERAHGIHDKYAKMSEILGPRPEVISTSKNRHGLADSGKFGRVRPLPCFVA